MAAPHGADPVKEFHTRRYTNQEGHKGEERQKYLARSEHVVGPHSNRERGDCDCGCDQTLVTKDWFAAKDRQDFCCNSKERKRENVNLGVAEEPE